MAIVETYKGRSGVEYVFEYHDADSFADLDYSKCRQVRAVCFYEDKIIIGRGGKTDINSWGFIGGTIEPGETFEETLRREVREESNTEVISSLPIGYQKCVDTRDQSCFYQLRYVCKVRKIGEFVSDPAGSIREIKFVAPGEYKKYFDWHKIGDRIIERALTLKNKL